MTISYNLDLEEITELTWPMWEAHGIECPKMIGGTCPADLVNGSAFDCPDWSAKFPNAAAEVVHSWTLDSGQSEECGTSTEGPAWYALFRNADKSTHDGPAGAGLILCEVSVGAVDVTRYDTPEELERAWTEALTASHVCPYENTYCTYDTLCTPCEES